MNRIAFVLMSMVLFTGAVTGCNEKIDNNENKKENIQHIIFNNNETDKVKENVEEFNNVEEEQEDGLTEGEKQEIILPTGIREMEIVLSISDNMELPGTLTLPAAGNGFPCIVLVHGSGPNDRDETILGNKPFRDIAWGLARKGIATYRYDKRTKVYQNELKNDFKLTINEEVVDDAVSAVNMLANLDEINKDEIYVLGHSLGGYAIPRIADKLTNSAGYIIMAGNVRGIDEIIKEQYEYLSKIDGYISADEQLQIDALELELNKIDNINRMDSKTLILGAYKEYWKDLKKYEPIEMARNINKPVLVLQGERDYQVTITEYNLWKGAFGNNVNWSFIKYSKLNHLMIAGEGNSEPKEYLTKGNVDESVIDDIGKWIQNY